MLVYWLEFDQCGVKATMWLALHCLGKEGSNVAQQSST